MKYAVPIKRSIDAVKYVHVEADTEEDAIAEVQRRLDLVNQARYDDPLIAELTPMAMQDDIDELRGERTAKKDLKWIPSLPFELEPVELDHSTEVIEDPE